MVDINYCNLYYLYQTHVNYYNNTHIKLKLNGIVRCNTELLPISSFIPSNISGAV